MSEENGFTEAYRVRFTLPVGEILLKWARLESRSIPSMIQDLVHDGIYYRITLQNKAIIKQKIIQGGEKV